MVFLLFSLTIALGALVPSSQVYTADGVTVRVLSPREGIAPRLFDEKRKALDAQIEQATQRRNKAEKAVSDRLYLWPTGERGKYATWFENKGAGKPARNKMWAIGEELGQARLRANQFDSDFRYEPEKGKQLEQDGPLRDEAWAAIQNYYDLHLKYLTYDAVYHETRLAQVEKYIEFEVSDFLAEMGTDLATIGWETISATLGAFFSECIDGALTKIITDYTSVLGLSAYGPGGGGPMDRFWDCALDSLKDSIAQMFVSVTKVNFLHTVENLKIPQRVGEYWWDELIIGKASSKPGFKQAVQDTLTGFKDAVAGVKGKQGHEWAAGIWVRSLKRLRGQYVKHIQSTAYRRGLIKNAVADMRHRGIPISNRAELRSTLVRYHKGNAANFKDFVDTKLDMDAVLRRADFYEIVLKIGTRLLEIYYNFADFNWNNEMGRYYEVKRCLEHWSKKADPERIVERLRAPAADYTAFLRSCDPEKDTEYDRLISEAEAILEQIDISQIPTGLMEEFVDLTAKIDEAVDYGTQNEENLREAVSGYQRICERDTSEWQALQDTVSRFPGDVQAAADAVAKVKTAADQACSVQVYDQAKSAASQAGDNALRVAQINDALTTAIQGLNLEQERVPTAEPGDADQLLADLRVLGQSLQDLKGRVEAGFKIKEDMLALIREGLSKSGRFLSDRAQAAAGKFSELLSQAEAIAIPAPDLIPPFEQKLGNLITSLEDAQNKLAEAIKCTESLPDISQILLQAKQTTADMRDHMQAAAIGKQRAETCVADWVARITQATMEDIKACRFDEAEAKYASLPADTAIRNDLRWEIQKARTNDDTANSVYDRVEEHYRAGDVDAAQGLITALPAELGCAKTQARRGPLEARVTQAINSKRKADAATKACRFDAARAAIGGITGETQLRRILEKNIAELEIPANERKHKINWLLGRVKSRNETGRNAVRRIQQIANEAECADVRQAALTAIASLQGSGDSILARAGVAMDKCDLERAWGLLDRVPMQNPGRKPAYGRFIKLEKAEKAAAAALKAAGKLSGANKYSAAIQTLDKAMAQKPCAKTVQRLRRAKGLVGRFGSTYSAIRNCQFKRASQLLKSLPKGSARKRLSALNQRSQSAMQNLNVAERELSSGRRTQARRIAQKVLGLKVLCKKIKPRARRIIARAKPLPKPKPKPAPRRPRGSEDHPHPPSTGGQNGQSPICQRYATRMQSIGSIQQNLARRVQRGISAGEARSIQGQIIANTRKIHTLIDQSRAAGCHNSKIPEQYRRQFDRHFGR